jgi:hypothetical protein
MRASMLMDAGAGLQWVSSRSEQPRAVIEQPRKSPPNHHVASHVVSHTSAIAQMQETKERAESTIDGDHRWRRHMTAPICIVCSRWNAHSGARIFEQIAY